MSRLVLFEDDGYVNLLPLVFWRTVFELRVGRKIMLDHIAQVLGLPVAGVWTREWIARVAAHRCGSPANKALQGVDVLVNGRWVPDGPLRFPSPPHVGLIDGTPVYIVCDSRLAERVKPEQMLDPVLVHETINGISSSAATGRLIRYPWEIVRDLRVALQREWQDGDAAMESRLDPRVSLAEPARIHIGEKVDVHPTAVIDAAGGPIYISHDVKIGPYAVIEGPAYLGPGTKINPHSWLHGGNAIGPLCKVGGEIDACVIDGFSNKQHQGFLGHSYVGSWVNLGAGACNSDLKNTYGSVRVPINGTEVDSGEMFVGAVIADHAKIGINAALPTGAVIGFASTVATGRVVPKYVPSFGWVTDERTARGDPARLLDVAARVMARRGVEITDDEVELFLDLGARSRDYERAPL
jgi:UDP-N-acetylglucosamine diphosphorylase/glucosamine-1-phosphate N-acetyltransferase